jgi:outer membrane protein TolC
MGGRTSGKGPTPRRWTTGLLALALVAQGAVRAGDAKVLPPPAKVETGIVVAGYDLDALRATALAHNPAIAAAKASLASAIAGQQGVENLRVPTCLQPDLPFRRQQAALGVQAAEAGVRNAELHVAFGVQFAYVSYLYAKEQERLVRKSVEEPKEEGKDEKEKKGSLNLAALVKSVRKVTAKDSKVGTDLRERDALFLEGVLAYARSRLSEAENGSGRALSALREAVGVGCDVPLPLKHQRLLDVQRSLNLRQLTDLALTNRPDLLAASINTRVSELEVQAQGSRNSLNVRTFASGADLHAIPLPAGRYDQEYRPAVVGPEMPPFLSGKKCDRVARASALASRAGSVADKARALITLEVEQAFLRHEEAAAKVASLTQSAAKLKTAIEGTKDVGIEGKAGYVKGIEGAAQRLAKTKFEDDTKPVLDDLLKFGQVYSQVQVQLNEARYQKLIALITLERATGAAFRADLCSAPEVNDE